MATTYRVENLRIIQSLEKFSDFKKLRIFDVLEVRGNRNFYWSPAFHVFSSWISVISSIFKLAQTITVSEFFSLILSPLPPAPTFRPRRKWSVRGSNLGPLARKRMLYCRSGTSFFVRNIKRWIYHRLSYFCVSVELDEFLYTYQ